LEDIPGIGKATADMLVKEFRSVNNIREIIREGKGEIEIGKVTGISKAKLIVKYFSGKS
jgi:excinuclease ABC subunit C